MSFGRYTATTAGVAARRIVTITDALAAAGASSSGVQFVVGACGELQLRKAHRSRMESTEAVTSIVHMVSGRRQPRGGGCAAAK